MGDDSRERGALSPGPGRMPTLGISLADAFIPFGTARYDFFGGNRAGNNLFGNSLVALKQEIAAGKKV